MAAIYSNAYLVIGATKADDCHRGFLDPVNQRLYNYGTHTYFHCDLDKGKHEPLVKRAWTLQEQLLASRMVHFTSSEMIWKCKTRLLCFCKQLDSLPSLPYVKKSYLAALSSSTPDDIFTIWLQVVQSLTGRSLTYPTDLLPAISGIARQIQSCGVGVYLAGMWADSLPKSLLWYRIGDWFRDPSQPTNYIAPTWSWASLYSSGRIESAPAMEPKWETKYDIMHTKVLSFSTTPKGKDPTGEVTYGSLTLSGPLIRVEFYEYDKNREQVISTPRERLAPFGDGYSESLKCFIRFDREFSKIPNHGPLFCLFVAEEKYDKGNVERGDAKEGDRKFSGLVLKASGKEEGALERVGMFGDVVNEGGASSHDLFLKAVETVVKII
ncbi:hypothetical protein BKA61DRAFT_103887 [Leptodontidium sp. MPI-SDFR-AT-0119]|nr:hypothetical protein BKA61DRAFT_103887 [Leptodontidium sp. MPI-SDFR-AT-0119]